MARILIFSAGFPPGVRGGGPIKSVQSIVDTVDRSHEVLVVTRDYDLGTRDPYPGLSGRVVRRRDNVQVFYLPRRSPLAAALLLRLIASRPFDVVYLNSLFSPTYSLVPMVLAILGVVRANRVLVAPRGELSPGALELKARKKSAALHAIRLLLRLIRATIHATSELEAQHAANRLPGLAVLTVPNQGPDPAIAVRESLPGPIRAVFISRISTKKKLDVLLAALESVAGFVHLDVYGPLEDQRYWRLCQTLIRRVSGTVRVSYRGVLVGEEVQAVFASSDVFFFPTGGENFGHVISESLSVGCPVVCPPTTPWTDVLRRGGGAVVPGHSSAAWQSEIDRWARKTPERRSADKRRALTAYGDHVALTRPTNVVDAFLSGATPRSASR